MNKLIVVLIAAFALEIQIHAATPVVLTDYNLGGPKETAQWASGSLNSTGTDGTPVNATTAGVGTIAPISPGYTASMGYYSWMGNFGLTATTFIQSPSVFSDIQNVVFQRVSMANPEFSLDYNLNWNGINPEGTNHAPGAAYGGPNLFYSIDNGATFVSVPLTPTFTGLGNTWYSDGSTTGFAGTFYGFTYQWDLSGIEGNVTHISISAPIIQHSATMEAQIDISGVFTQVVPEPTVFSLLGLGVGSLMLRRRRTITA